MTQDYETPFNAVKSSEVVGVNVQNTNKENLGKIEEIVIDKLKGQVRYVVLSFGGFLGLGDKYFAFPWQALRFDESTKSFILETSKEKLSKAEGFDKSNWPDMTNREWEKGIYSYYGYEPYWMHSKTL